MRSAASAVPPSGAAGPLVISVGALVDRAVAVDAVDLDRVARLAIELAVAVIVLPEVAVDALHPLLEVDVLQVHRLAEPLGIVVRDDPVVLVEQVAAPVALVDGAVDPAVAVEVGELRVLRASC